MKVSRRDFLKISAGAGAAATFMNREVLHQAMAIVLQNQATTNLAWVQGQSCNGCTISALQWVDKYDVDSTYYTNLISFLQNGESTDIEFHPMLMPQAGAYWSDDGVDYNPYSGITFGSNSPTNDETYVGNVMDYLLDVVNNNGTSETTYCVVEGPIPYEKWGDNEEQGFCVSGLKNLGGKYQEGQMWTINEIIKKVHDSDIEVFIAFGNCAAFGGVPGGSPNPTGAKGLQHFLEDCASDGGQFGPSLSTPMKQVINLPGCPAHPEHLIMVYAALLQGGMNNIHLDRWNRPVNVTLDGNQWIKLFGTTVHDMCDRKDSFEKGWFATSWSQAIDPVVGTSPEEYYCLLRLGCRGPDTFSNCSDKGTHSFGLAGSSGWNPGGVGIWNNDRDNTVSEDNPGSWCVAAGAPCNGCTTTTFPDNVLGNGFFKESKHSEMLAAGKLPGSASGATPEYEGKGVACYTCHAVSMPRKSKEWIK